MKKHSAIKTSLGVLKGRDCIYLDKLNLSNKSSLVIEGQINRSLLESPAVTSLKFLPYRLEFIGVLAFKVIDLETWSHQFSEEIEVNASFVEVLNSKWIESLCNNRVNSNRHYLVQTHDNVIEVICRQFKLTI